MKSSLQNDKAVYSLLLNGETIEMNKVLDKSLEISFRHKINCIVCGRETKKSFGQGFCYQCFIKAPEADDCILRPLKCKAHLGISRDMKWSENHCLQPHVVYLAVSGGLKVGVTRLSQVPTRWIDQGATRAIRMCETPNRHIAGVIESFLMNHFGDKTNWRKMVSNAGLPEIDLLKEKRNAIGVLPEELKRYVLADDEHIFQIGYPVLKWPHSPQQSNLDKNPIVRGVLTGIRGQYLFFDKDEVFNVRRFSGYAVDIIIEG